MPSRPGQQRLGPPSLADRFLVPGERPVIVVRRHVVVLLRPLVEFVAAVTVLGWFARAAESDVIDNLVGWGILAVAARALYKAAWWDRERITVTDKRLMLTNGVFNAKVAVMPIMKITDLSFRQSTAGLLLGWGELTIESAGQNQALNVLGYLPDPQLVYETVSQVVHTNKPGSGGPQPPSTPGVPPAVTGSGDGPDELVLPTWVNDGWVNDGRVNDG